MSESKGTNDLQERLNKLEDEYRTKSTLMLEKKHSYLAALEESFNALRDLSGFKSSVLISANSAQQNKIVELENSLKTLSVQSNKAQVEEIKAPSRTDNV